eukprot:g13652.t1
MGRGHGFFRLALLLLLVDASLDALPGIADHQLIDAYEELVANVTKFIPPGLEDLPQRLILFSAWYIASRTLWSALRGEKCACYESVDNLSEVPPMMRLRMLGLDRGIWSLVAKRAMYLAEITQSHPFQGDSELEETRQQERSN